MESIVTRSDIVAALEELNLRKRRVIVHAALSSFGRVEGGANTVANALLDVAETVLVPAFSYSPAAIPPANDRPQQNGTDYVTERLGDENPTPFTLDLPVAKPIGILPETIRQRPDALRSSHPLSSFAAMGEDAKRYVVDHDYDHPMLPLQRLTTDNGQILMIGTSFSSCTAVHLGELLVGRRPFIRWAMDAEGAVHRVRVGGCSEGFDALEPVVEGVCEVKVGQARLRTFSIANLLRATQHLLTQNNHALVCADRCRRCLDAALGGPLE